MPTAIIAGVGPLELLLVLVIVLVIFGRRLPALGRQLGEGMRGFKDSLSSRSESHASADDGGPVQARPALGRPTGEETPVDGEVMRERR